jgi:hypothetical protein
VQILADVDVALYDRVEHGLANLIELESVEGRL